MFVRKKTYDQLFESFTQLSNEMNSIKEENERLKEELESLKNKNESFFHLNEEDEEDKVLFLVNVKEDQIQPKVSMSIETINWLAENDYINEEQLQDETAQSLAMLLIVSNTLHDMLEKLHIEHNH